MTTSRRLGMRNVVTAVLVTLMVTLVASQFPVDIQEGLNAGTDESDQRLREVLSDENISNFVGCMIKPWGETCDERAPIMAIMIKFALRDNLKCSGCSDRVKNQMKFIETRLKAHSNECVRLLDGINFSMFANRVCTDSSTTV